MGWIMAQGWGMLRHGWGGVLEGLGGVLKTGKGWEVGMMLFSFQPHFNGCWLHPCHAKPMADEPGLA